MRTMVRSALLTVLGTAMMFAQAKEDLFTKAPPAVEEALSARVKTFYELQFAGKFRAADQYVAEDSKDTFYSADKPDCKTWKLDRIQWNEGFKSARSISTCDTNIMTIAGPLLVKRPIVATWKLVDGNWFWYVPPAKKELDTPFGTMKPGPEGPGGGAFRMPSMQEIVNQVKIDKNEIIVETSRKSIAELTFTNSAPGEAALSMEAPSIAGLTVKLDRNRVPGGSSAKITFQYEPTTPKPSGATSLTLRVEPFARMYEVKILFR